MKPLSQYNFWFITGSQHLYGPEVLVQVRKDAEAIAAGINGKEGVPANVIFKAVVTTPDEITKVMRDATYDDTCAGVITWMHTFSPSKMWINGFAALQKPLLHLHTQFNRDLPYDTIDMDFMNLNQSAHGDREHGFIGARMRMARKVVVGYWDDEEVADQVGAWMRSAVGVAESKKLKVCRFGDNMREVAVTEGDKVEAQIKFGWSVNTQAVGDLVNVMNEVTEAEVDAQMAQYEERYDIITEDIASVRYQAKIEVAIRKMFAENDFGAFTTNFQDLHGMDQLPGLACQNLMADGYGFGGEGDWKTAALLRIMKLMAAGQTGGTAFMEDYTYHLEKGNEMILGAHMLEVCPTVAADKPRIDVQPLGIGDRQPPARLIFNSKPGKAICASLVDMGGRMRLIVADVEAKGSPKAMPNLPVAGIMWKPLPDLQTSAAAWIYAGGAHHTVMSYDITAEQMADWAEMMDIEYVHIGEETTIPAFKHDLLLSDLVWKLK